MVLYGNCGGVWKVTVTMVVVMHSEHSFSSKGSVGRDLHSPLGQLLLLMGAEYTSFLQIVTKKNSNIYIVLFTCLLQ